MLTIMSANVTISKAQRIDLGLALLSFYAEPGEQYGYDEIAEWCDCTPEFIRQIEQRALKKLRVALRWRDPGLCAELLLHYR